MAPFDPKAAPIGFDARAAAEGIRFNGFYLFRDFSEPQEG